MSRARSMIEKKLSSSAPAASHARLARRMCASCDATTTTIIIILIILILITLVLILILTAQVRLSCRGTARDTAARLTASASTASRHLSARASSLEDAREGS